MKRASNYDVTDGLVEAIAERWWNSHEIGDCTWDILDEDEVQRVLHVARTWADATVLTLLNRNDLIYR